VGGRRVHLDRRDLDAWIEKKQILNQTPR